MQMVASIGRKDTGAVASARAAEIYGLDILQEKIQVRLIFLFPFLVMQMITKVTKKGFFDLKTVLYCIQVIDIIIYNHL